MTLNLQLINNYKETCIIDNQATTCSALLYCI